LQAAAEVDMSSRVARDEEVERWREDGWALLDGLIGTDEIDAAAEEMWHVFPSPAQYHADPEGETEKRLGIPPAPNEEYVWPATGPGFRPEQHRWKCEFPFPGPNLNRLCVHPSIVDFMERALADTDLRLYQAQINAKFAGAANYEQPLHTDRNHSWLPARVAPPWWHVESFLYLSDVTPGSAPTHLVPLSATRGQSTTVPLLWPTRSADVYAAEQPAAGPRGSLLVYRPDVFHRGVDLTDPEAARYLLNVSFKIAGQDWIGFHSMQSRATSPHWVAFVEGSTPRELDLFGFPSPGHPIWNAALLDDTAERYPNLDLTPWRAALA
jgi:hypothetical protein